MNCEKCKFFEVNDFLPDEGWCHCNPPVLISWQEMQELEVCGGEPSAWNFPAVLITDWCGEFKRRSR